MRTDISIVINKDDFDRFREIIVNDPEFPQTFEEFDSLRTENEAKSISRGRAIKKVIMNLGDFVSYCKASGLECNTATLGAAAIFKSAKDMD